MYSILYENYPTDSEIYKRFIDENKNTIIDDDGIKKYRFYKTFFESYKGEAKDLFDEAEQEAGEPVLMLMVIDERTNKDVLIYKHYFFDI